MNAVLILCTANICRSVLAQGLLSARLAARGGPVPVASAGLLGSGRQPPAEVVSLMAARGIDVTAHRSRLVTAADLAGADLILGLSREHVRHAAVLLPDAWTRSFTLRELVRRGRQVGPRTPGEPTGDWLARAAAGRDRRDLLGSNPLDDVADPYGGPFTGYRAAAGLLDELAGDLAALCWPGQPARPG
jgi:protein-tyrosine phosphatase